MAPLERVQVLLANGPIGLWPAVDLSRAVHRQPRRGIVEDQPLHPVYPWEVFDEIRRVTLEDRLDVRLIALQGEWAGADGGLDLLEIAVFLHHLAGDDPHAPRVGQDIDEPDIGL